MRFRVEKLIRDNLAAKMRENGIVVHERFLDGDEFLFCLKEKLLEEAQKVHGSSKKGELIEELVEELVDIQEAMLALCEKVGITPDEIEAARLKKREVSGGFEKGIYLSCVDIEENNPAVEFYLKQPERYPHIGEEKPDCLFCQIGRRTQKGDFLESYTHCFAIQDKFPVTRGHILIIPYEHTESWFTAREEVRLDMIRAVQLLKERVDAEYHPQGYNLGVNCGKVAGQTIMHLHLHLIPRYTDDMIDPTGGVRGVIPSKQKY